MASRICKIDEVTENWTEKLSSFAERWEVRIERWKKKDQWNECIVQMRNDDDQLKETVTCPGSFGG